MGYVSRRREKDARGSWQEADPSDLTIHARAEADEGRGAYNARRLLLGNIEREENIFCIYAEFAKIRAKR